MILEIKDLTKYFGGLAAIHHLDMQVYHSEILGLIGPNGAGKTTLFNIISGFIPPTHGTIIFNGKDITRLKPHQISQIGISRTFQATTLFMKISVLENVFTGFHMNLKTNLFKRLLYTRSARQESSTLKQGALEILNFMGLDFQKDELAENLSHGYQRILGICLALATRPKLLMLDEPVAGMNRSETQRMINLIGQIREKDITIIVVEHDMKMIMNLCDRIVVLDYGRKIAEGSPQEIKENKEVIEAYLGKSKV